MNRHCCGTFFEVGYKKYYICLLDSKVFPIDIIPKISEDPYCANCNRPIDGNIAAVLEKKEVITKEIRVEIIGIGWITITKDEYEPRQSND